MVQLSTTLRALAAPRRGLPIALVIVSLVAVQVHYAGEPFAALVPLGMAAAFLVVGPWSWRVLLGRRSTQRSTPALVVGVLGFVCEAVVVVAVFGIAVPQTLGLGPTFLTDAGSLVVATVLYVVGGWGLGRDIELEHSLEHIRVKAIRTHLDPHFLYNTLNAIAEWCVEDPKVAENATLRLAAMLRDILDGLEQESWPLARETALVEDLLELHRMRDVDAFSTRIEIDHEAKSIAVPPLVIVSLVENAIKHGPRKGHHGTIEVRIHATATGLRCVIENAGPLAPEPVGGGRGIANVRARLALAYGRPVQLAFEGSPTSARTRVALELPRRPA